MSEQISSPPARMNRVSRYYYLEWVLNHPRFGALMMVLIALSFSHNPWLAALLFVIFSTEIGLRIALLIRKARTNPYRASSAQKMDILFLALDVVGVASLLITIFGMPFDGPDATMARWVRALYLLRTLRFFRYLDMQSAMSSPTYGMLTSLIIMLSFVATNTLLWVLIIYFVIELVVRVAVMRTMRFETDRERITEWIFWWLDTVATILMIPAFAVIPHGGALRMFRLIRLLRPWMMIFRNLRIVMREGQYLQEINLVVLITAVLSIGGGALAQMMLGPFDYSQENGLDPNDNTILAPIWFMFRLLTDPGNAVHFPESAALALITIVTVIIGVFLFSFFIGIGSNIVSGLMDRLRNERLMMSNHAVLIGWSHVAPHILHQLRRLSEHYFSSIKLALLLPSATVPAALGNETWVNHRFGTPADNDDLLRVSANTASEALLMLPDNEQEAASLANASFGYLALRRINPTIDVTIAMSGKAYPRLKKFDHMLQIGWDREPHSAPPPTTLSEITFRASSLSNAIVHQDFELIMQQLLIPPQSGESALQAAEWEGTLHRDAGRGWMLQQGSNQQPLLPLLPQLFARGAILLALIDDHYRLQPIYALDQSPRQGFAVRGVLGIAVSTNALCGELTYVLRNPDPMPSQPPLALAHHRRHRHTLRLLVIGWVGGIPKLLDNLLSDFQAIQLTIIDHQSAAECQAHQRYLQAWRDDAPTIQNDDVTIRVVPWDLSQMEIFTPYLADCDVAMLAAPSNSDADGFSHITTTLSHLVAIAGDLAQPPRMVALMQDETQAERLQKEIDRAQSALDIHVMVPDALYGTYIAHHLYHRHRAEDRSSRRLNRVLHQAISDIMINDPHHDRFSLHLLKVEQPLPERAEALFMQLLEQQRIWIGYRLQSGVTITPPTAAKVLQRLFPQPASFISSRQRHLILNPFGNPLAAQSWAAHRHHIAALITITTDANAACPQPEAEPQHEQE